MLIMQVALIPLLEFVTNHDIHNKIWQWKNNKKFQPRIPPRFHACQHRLLGLAIFTSKFKLIFEWCM